METRSAWIEQYWSTDSMSLLSVVCGVMQPAQTLSYTLYINFDNASTRESVRMPRAAHSASPLSLALLALACEARLARDTCSIAHPAHCASGPCRFDPQVAWSAHRGHPSSCPILHARCLCSPHLSLYISRPLTAKRLPGLFPNPQRQRDVSS